MQRAIKQKTKKIFSTHGSILQNPKRKIFEIIFVRNDEEQSVEVDETPFIDFHKVIENLEKGNSVFITSKKN